DGCSVVWHARQSVEGAGGGEVLGVVATSHRAATAGSAARFSERRLDLDPTGLSAAFSGLVTAPALTVVTISGRRRDSPLSSIRCAFWSSLSRMASAMVASPRVSCQWATGSWLVTMV